MIYDITLPGGRTIKTEIPTIATGESFEATLDGEKTITARVESFEQGELCLAIGERRYRLHVAARHASPDETDGTEEIQLALRNRLYTTTISSELDRLRAAARAHTKPSGPVTLHASLPGVVRQVFVSEGDEVDAGAPMMTLEAMKMENELTAEISGKVEELFVKPGQTVAAREALARIAPG